MEKQQLIFIHGGETFDHYNDYVYFLESCTYNPYEEKEKRWKDSLGEKLGDDYLVISPLMPSKYNAKYIEWKLWFEKIFQYLEGNTILVGHSLGGIFIAKYLSENHFPNKILATYLIAAPYDEKDSEYSLADFILPESLKLLEKQGGKICLYHSKDDPIVPFLDLEKYSNALPDSQKIVFDDRGHFLQAAFPELIDHLQGLN